MNDDKQAAKTSEPSVDECRQETVYHTPEEWASLYVLPEYHENKEITGRYDRKLAAKCINGTFVGKCENGCKIWRGIPFADIPGRFERSAPPKPSRKVMEAYYYGKSCMQPESKMDLSSKYEQGETDILTLSIYTADNEIKKKPVMVFIHGGWMLHGGTAMPMYNGSNFVRYNPDMIVVTITYRVGLLGQINLSDLPDYNKKEETFATSTNNGLLDQIEALRWIRKNIPSFGGDSENITICGESSGAWAVSSLVMMVSNGNCTWIAPEEKLFQRAIATSGGVNQCVTVEESKKLTQTLMKDFNAKTINDLQDIPFEDLKKWWQNTQNYTNCNLAIVDGIVVPNDPLDEYKRTVKDQIVTLQGATTNEFRFLNEFMKAELKIVKVGSNTVYSAVDAIVTSPSAIDPKFKPSSKFRNAYDKYMNSIDVMGYKSEGEKKIQMTNDCTFQGINCYMAKMQADNGGTSYVFVFDQGYDGVMKELGAIHAAECVYLFGNFDGNACLGTEEEVDFSIKYQNMIAKFCRTGDPSTDSIEFKKYDSENGYCTVISSTGSKLTKNYQQGRLKALFEMIENNKYFRIVPSISRIMSAVTPHKKQ